MRSYLVRSLCSLTAVGLLAACSAGTPTTEGPTPEADPMSEDQLPPPGYGTLRQDAFTIALAQGPLQIKVTPLDEGVIRLAAPDTYQRLHGLVESRSQRIQELAARAGLREMPAIFLVSFFTRDRQVTYEPTALQMLSRGILYRPAEILPVTPQWGRQQLKQQETQTALYIYDPSIDLDVTFEVEYEGERSLAWASIIRILQAERGRVIGRAKG